MAFDFKSAEEVQDYLKNLSIEYRFGCYKENNPEACHLLGDYLEAIDKDYKKAVKLFEKNCDSHNFPKSCLKFANFVALGKGIENPDQRKALRYYNKACELGEMTACYRAGVLTILDSGSPNSKLDCKQGLGLLEKACNNGNAEACHHLSGMYLEGFEPAKILKDMKKAHDFATKACDLNNIYSCANLSIMYKKGDGIEANMEISKKYKAKAEELKAEMRQEIKFQEGIKPV
uniref:Cytochrome c oxidase assembly factor 7 n=1 Tax=Clastoptera arizonana TaxID=38151 RepID=A0A1B6DXD8_9HEMI